MKNAQFVFLYFSICAPNRFSYLSQETESTALIVPPFNGDYELADL